MSSNTLLISGYYGFGNIGDEAVLAGILAGLRRVAPAVTPVVLTADPERTTALHQVPAVQRESMSAVWHAISNGSALLSGGGSLLQDVTSRRSVYYYLGVMAMAHIKHRPFCLYGQGIGPLVTPAARQATRLVLRRSKGIWVRDTASRQLLHELLGNRPDVQVTGDAAFLLPAPDTTIGRQQLRAAISQAGVNTEAPIWLVVARPWLAVANWQPALISALTQAARVVGATLAFLSMHASLDQAYAESLVAAIKEQGVPACAVSLTASSGGGTAIVGDNCVETASSLLAGADMVIAMRLHALLLAAAAGVPGVAVSYDPKVMVLAQELRLPWVSLEQLAEDEADKSLANAVLQAWQDRATLALSVQTKAAEWQQQAQTGLRAAVAALGLPVHSNVTTIC